jgi:tetratricopeptide (TPR) repeat protein
LGELYAVLKQNRKAIEAFDDLLREEPEHFAALRGRGDAYLNIGKHAEALADYEKALKLQPKDYGLLNNLAWLLATSPDDKIRDGRRAIDLATDACRITEYQLPHILSTLAAAYAETGDFDAAVKWSSKAVEMNDPQHGEELKKELESYKAKKPWRELLAEEPEKPQPEKPAKDK